MAINCSNHVGVGKNPADNVYSNHVGVALLCDPQHLENSWLTIIFLLHVAQTSLAGKESLGWSPPSDSQHLEIIIKIQHHTLPHILKK